MKFRASIMGLTLAVTASFAASGASAEPVLCLKKGKIKIREDVCKEHKGEVLLDLAEFGVAGEPGEPGAPGTARAYAAVVSRGVAGVEEFVDEQTHNFEDIRSPIDGVYCLTMIDEIDPETVAPVVSENQLLSDGSKPAATFVKVRAPFVCKDGEIEVLTMRFNANDNLLVDLVDDVGFNIIVP
ncbi:MAG: hypothetical protein ACQGVK_09860 [Myxococcota bacterium]